MKSFLKKITIPLIIILNTLIILELLFFVFFKVPNLNKSIPYFLPILKEQYMARRNIVQFMPDCAEYSDKLTYKLKPGNCQFNNAEFQTKLEINDFGLRDDNESLKKPEIIVLGDSLAMGWGVNQEETFAQILEKTSGKKVLNSAISSYGTAREFTLLEQLDSSNLKYIILEYCNNDMTENKSYVENKFSLKISSKEDYEKTVLDLEDKTHYIPLDFSTKVFRKVSRVLRGKYKQPEAVTRDEELNNLVKILAKIQQKHPQTKIILLELNGDNQNDPEFSNMVKNILNKVEYKSLKKNVTIMDSSKILTAEDYFILDDHITAPGHQKIANKIIELIK